MIHDYYCMDCGNRLKGEEIMFNLGEILGIKRTAGTGDNGSGPEETASLSERAMLISVDKLMEIARKNKVQLKHGERVMIRVTLRDFLTIMGSNVGRAQGRENMMAELMDRSKKSDLRQVLREVYSTGENAEVEDHLINAFRAQLETAFPLSEKAEKFIWELEENENITEEEKKLIGDIRDSMENYVAITYLEPEFFENGRSDKIYTVRYTKDPEAAVLNTPAAPLEIRGYCPKCGKPVLCDAGKYPHQLIGLLGVQSAGKTSLVVALVRELQEFYFDLGVAYPGQLLCDSRYEIMRDNFELYDNGWAVAKTPIIGTGGTFNATLLLGDRDNEENKKLITFADIAGELCYDVDKKAVDMRAFRQFPLVKACDMYVLCTCIDQSGYGNADGENKKLMPPEAPLDITLSIYNEIYKDTVKGRKIPPLCIVLTKTDMVGKPNMNHDEKNPLDGIAANPNYQFKTQLENLRMTYDSFQEQNIRIPIRRACALYHEISKKAYVSMMSCSALGRKGEMFKGNLENITPYTEDGKERPFERIRLSDLWSWILQVSGLSAVGESNYHVVRIPSFREYYSVESVDARFITNLRRRLNGVSQLFINSSNQDRVLASALKGPVKRRFLQKEQDAWIDHMKAAVQNADAVK